MREWYYRVRHVLSWVPFLWHDKDWDQHFLLEMMREKLRRMRLYHEQKRITASWERVAHELRVAEILLTRLLNEDYTDKDYEAHEAKYGSMWERMVDWPDGGSVLPSTHSTEEGARMRHISRRHAHMVKQDAQYLAQWVVKHWQGWWS